MTDPVDTDALRALADVHDGPREPDHTPRMVADAIRTAADEVDRLRTVIENAPHAENCQILFWQATWGARAPKTAHCTCWKADAL